MTRSPDRFHEGETSRPWRWKLHNQLKKDFAAAKAEGLVTGSLQVYIQPSFATATPEQQSSAIQRMVNDGADGILLRTRPRSTAPRSRRCRRARTIKIIGTVWGQWNPATTKSVELQFLASHPGKIDFVMHGLRDVPDPAAGPRR